MDLEIKKFLYDIMVAVDSIENYLGEKRGFNIYHSNKMLRRAIERNWKLLERLNRIDKLDPTICISSKKQIINMRNRVIHGYDKIDDEIVWGVLVRHLPILKTEIAELLK